MILRHVCHYQELTWSVAGLKNQPSRRQRWIIYTDTIGRDEASSSVEILPFSSRFCRLDPAQRDNYLFALRARVLSGASQNVLRSELLLSVSQYNIIRAMASNAAMLGLSMDSLRHDILSPFNTAPYHHHKQQQQQPLQLELPCALRPTSIQREVTHHPWIDLCPVPSIRDLLLTRRNEYDEDGLCHDLFGGFQGHVGLLVWGEAWDPEA